VRNKLLWHQIVLFAVILVLTVARWFSGRILVNVDLLLWWLGGVVGFLFVFADRLVYAFASNHEEVLSVKIKELFGKGRLVAGLALAFSEREKQKRLVMRSALFLVIWIALAVFTATSVANSFSRGLILGLGTHLIFDLTWDYFGKVRDVEFWFWQVKKINKIEIDWFVRGSILFYLLIIWFL